MKIVDTSHLFLDKDGDHKSDNRANFVMAFIGHNRTGKTSLAIETAKTWKKAHPEANVLVFDPQLKFDGIKTLDINPINKNWAQDCLGYPNSLIILDDYRLLNRQNVPEEGLLELLHFRNEYNIDIIYITHSPALVLNALTYYTTHYWIFYTLSQAASFEKKIPNYDLCIAASKLVNRHVKSKGKGKWPKFPHCIVDTETQKVEAYNIDNEVISTFKEEEADIDDYGIINKD